MNLNPNLIWVKNKIPYFIQVNICIQISICVMEKNLYLIYTEVCNYIFLPRWCHYYYYYLDASLP